MLKRKRNLFLINITIFQIILLIGMSFSISFLFSKYVGLGSAQAALDQPASLVIGSNVATPQRAGDVIVGSNGQVIGWKPTVSTGAPTAFSADVASAANDLAAKGLIPIK